MTARPWVCILMGSDSDATVMAQACTALDEAGVPRPCVVSRADQAQYPLDDDRVLQVYWSETDALGGPPSDGAPQWVSVTIHHMPANQSAEIERAILDEALPNLVEWLRAAASAPEGWRVIGRTGASGVGKSTGWSPKIEVAQHRSDHELAPELRSACQLRRVRASPRVNRCGSWWDGRFAIPRAGRSVDPLGRASSAHPKWRCLR